MPAAASTRTDLISPTQHPKKKPNWLLSKPKSRASTHRHLHKLTACILVLATAHMYFHALTECSRPRGGGALQISSVGDDQRIFLGSKFSVPGFFWLGKFDKYFFGWLDLSRNFLGHSMQSEDSW